jgi:hypothetical protein
VFSWQNEHGSCLIVLCFDAYGRSGILFLSTVKVLFVARVTWLLQLFVACCGLFGIF